MDTVKNIWKELWNNKPMLITVIVGLLILAYLFWRNIMVPAPDTTAPGVLPDGTTPSGDVGPPITVPGAPPPPPPPPVTTPPVNVIFQPKVPLPNVAPPSGKPQPPPARTVTVTPWPSQTSTLWGIAQKYYGNGALWPKIYQFPANRAKIGNNPNLIHSGLVLVVP